ncbi:Threonine/homoserine/homoserine lactone efflux protein [Paenibacillus uliginis N3/975]|uniref:Threonine/homoserine/homoserine lactone efflux protein n=2 Tax=Paenibacillus TaxID=44249 RepID=A0A1X7H9R2_9BACL|nr:Threonine/homoserine/homoserine lactone efflux protein [Paenibacillus uliginis N3/975]
MGTSLHVQGYFVRMGENTMSLFLSYIFLGLSLSAPVGPINAAQLDKGLKKGFWHAWLFGLGAVMADILYMVLVYMGVVHFLSTPFMQTFLWLFGAFVLIYTGIESVVSAGKVTISSNKKEDSLLSSVSSGFLMSLSNPMTILFWLGIYGSVLVKTASDYGTGDLLLYSAAVIFGVLIWDFLMAAMASTFRKYLSNRGITFISIISGLSLIGFGIYFGFRAIKLLFF